MSDPSIVIEPQDNNWRLDNRQPSHSGHISRRDQSKKNTNLRRGGAIDHPLFPPLLDHYLQTLVCTIESLEDPNNLIGREEDQYLLLLHHHQVIILRMITVDTRGRQIPQTAKTLITLQPAEITNVPLLFLSLNKLLSILQKTQVQNWSMKYGPLIEL